MKSGLCSLAFCLAIVKESAWSLTFPEGLSRRQLLKVAGYSSFGIVAAPVVAEDAVLSPTVEVAAVGDAKKVSGRPQSPRSEFESLSSPNLLLTGTICFVAISAFQ
jgi:hypothetical protein